MEYFFPTRFESAFLVPEGEMTVKVPRMKRFLEEERIKGEKELVLPFVREEHIWRAYTLRNDSEEELIRETLNLT